MGSINKISSVFLRNIYCRPYSGRTTISDGGGLSARISPNGKISWIFRYRLGGRESNPQWIGLGKYPEISLQQARAKREQYRAWVESGKDPKAETLRLKRAILEPVTNYNALEYWLVEYVTENRKDVTHIRALLNKHIYPFIGDIAVSDTETRHWVECFDRTRKGIKGTQRPAPVTAGYILQNAKQAMRFCRARHYVFSRVLDDLTVMDVGKKQGKKDRVLTNEELNQLWQLINASNYNLYHRNLMYLLLVFGCRTQEIRLSTWKEWDFKSGLWEVPVINSKSKQKIIRPIPEQLKVWLDSLKGDAGEADYILGEYKSAQAVCCSCGKYWKKLQHKTPWKLHDLRRTFATNLNELGIAPHIVEQILGHSLGGVMAIYNRSQYLSEKKLALDMWVKYLQSGCKADCDSNVVQFKTAT